MGDKIESKKAAQAAGVSCVPGFIGEIRDTEHALEISKDIGYPVMTVSYTHLDVYKRQPYYLRPIAFKWFSFHCFVFVS